MAPVSARRHAGRGDAGRSDAGTGDAEQVVVRIDGIAAGGAGVGRLPTGQVVFVQRTAPGDEALVRIRQRKRSWARAELLELRRPGAGRRAAPCVYYDRCGGCTLEHLEYEAQLRAKHDVVAEALRRIGGIEPPPFDVVASPDEFGYRNRVSFTLRRVGGHRVVAGFREVDRPDRVLDMTGACMLPESPVAQAWDALRAAWGAGAGRLPAGRELRLTLRGTADGDTVLLVEGGSGGRPAELIERVPTLRAVWHATDTAAPPVLVAGAADVMERWHDQRVALGGRTFLQVNRGVAARLETQVLEFAGDVQGRQVIDGYCGIGTHARRLAAAGAARVLAIELDAGAVEQAERVNGSAERPGATKRRVRFLAADVAEALPEALPADLVVLNPPRAGVDERVSAALADQPPGRLVYVSCDPATLARDAKRLAPMELVALRCFDMFPQTAHVETVALFE